MLKALLAIFKQDSKLDEAFRQSLEMLEITHDMFRQAKTALRETDSNQLDIAVYEQDKSINKYERKVRKNVLQHLAVAGTRGLASGLTLITIIIDIERIGDYTKNIVELAENHPARLKAGEAEADLRRVEKAVEETFMRVRQLLEVSDQEKAEAFIKEHLWVHPLCDRRMINYIKETDCTISPGDAVCLALYFRFLKRIHSHMRNIATSIYRPFHKIGFVSKKVKKSGREEPPE